MHQGSARSRIHDLDRTFQRELGVHANVDAVESRDTTIHQGVTVELLAKSLGKVHYFSEDKERELLDLKQQWGFGDPRNTSDYK